MRSHQVQSGDGVAVVTHAHGGSRKRGRRIKLTVVGAALMSMYTIFLYAVMASFDKSGHRELHEDRTSAVSASLRAGGGRDPLKESHDARASQQQQKEEPKMRPRALRVEDFCGMCQWRDMPFNCNERVEWVVKQKGASEKEAKESNLKFCTLPGCNAKANDEGFMQCEDLSTPSAKPDLATYPKVKHVDKAPELDAILSGSLLKDLFSRDIDITERIKSTKRVNEEGLRDRRSGEDLVASVLAAAKLGDREYDTEETSSARQQAVLGGHGGRTADMPVLTAYIEPINQTDWEQRPLPVRDGPSTKKTLFGVSYPNLHSCRAMQSQFPIDTPPVDLDSYLPWIHDVFPSHDGKDVIFIAQNRRRCYNGQRRMQMGEKAPDGVTTHKNYIHIDYGKNYFQRPQSALFQHVPVKKIGEEDGEPRYRLASHEDADKEGMETRFICRFKLFDSSASPNLSIVGYSLSAHEVDYDYHTYRKGYRYSATEAGFDNHMIWQSQLLFRCPVPEEYHNKVSRGELVMNDYATLYVDVVPIRTPPRYTPPREFLQPRYEFKNEIDNLFVPDFEWGKEHVLPKIDQSGRWENIPVCLPSLMNHGVLPEGADINELDVIVENDADGKYVPFSGVLPPKIHKVIACTWASTTFRTRSNRASVGDGKRRLKEWLEFNLLSGFDHIYVYDNSGAFTNEDSLGDIIELFSERVTRVDWPCKICSNRDGNEGERSSQYAAESSCRIRFGAHARWLGSFDTDEYLVPMGDFKSMGEVADELDETGVKVAVFKSSPAKPRLNLLENPSETEKSDGTFTPTVPADETFLHTYNCNWEQFPRKNDLSHRRKQMAEKETIAAKESWLHRYVERHVHEFDEKNEATMLHTKTKVAKNTSLWKTRCRQSSPSSEGQCHVGFPFPSSWVSGDSTKDSQGWGYNCFINERIEQYWWPKLVDAVASRQNR